MRPRPAAQECATHFEHTSPQKTVEADRDDMFGLKFLMGLVEEGGALQAPAQPIHICANTSHGVRRAARSATKHSLGLRTACACDRQAVLRRRISISPRGWLRRCGTVNVSQGAVMGDGDIAHAQCGVCAVGAAQGSSEAKVQCSAGLARG
ncbi:hypothetical protein P171DRAFT_236050 [Karstenula rhodostoma CBS 690.94]|uniref:Uncharacterized protein n=1 Tax=Karstenula rhodostoma CBS 690.94 TaxID=1392251 RepID=A0A9P4UDM4_9PLEO|nr:hypothetical protein P171DRAFT_236050 [Karstenula rhodostoma CBS 690.94]